MRYFFLILSAALLAPARAENLQPRIGEAAPAFGLKSLGGENVSLEALKGRWVVLQFAATWCPVTNQKLPRFEALHQKFKKQDAQFLVIDVAEKKKRVAKWAKRLKVSLPVLLDPKGKVAASYAPKDVKADLAREDVVVSASLIIDPEGKIRYFQLYSEEHPDSELSALEAKLKELLQL